MSTAEPAELYKQLTRAFDQHAWPQVRPQLHDLLTLPEQSGIECER